jgi:hypothetical protein
MGFGAGTNMNERPLPAIGKGVLNGRLWVEFVIGYLTRDFTFRATAQRSLGDQRCKPGPEGS